MDIYIAPLKRSQVAEVSLLLQNLSQYSPNPEHFDDIWLRHSNQANVFAIVAQQHDGQVLGFGSLLLETKIRGGKVAHIEDIVTHPGFRNQGIGHAVIDALVKIAIDEGCYKAALHCKEHNVSFYEKNGFRSSGIAMQTLLLNS